MPTDKDSTEPAAVRPGEPSARRQGGPGRRGRTLAGAVLPVVPGLGAAALIAFTAGWLARLFPVVGGPVLALAGGAVVGAAARRLLPSEHRERLRPGAAAAGRQVLQASLVVLGAGLPLGEVLRTGSSSLPVMLSTLAVALGGAWWVGRRLRVHPETGLLIGVGTGICGASAIAAVTAVVGAAQSRVAYALGTVFTFNIAAVLLYPALGHLLGLSQEGFGLWSGSAINDTSSVVAAAYSYGTVAGTHAVVVKLTRSLMIVPVCVSLQVWLRYRRSHRTAGGPNTAEGRSGSGVWQVFPLFVLGFLAMSAAATAGGIPTSWQPALTSLSSFLIATALAGIGLSLDVGRMRSAGLRPLALGAVLSVGVCLTALGVQAATGRL